MPACYIAGSLLDKDPFLGGITDIDLFCIHDRPVTTTREIIRINADVHLDMAHYEQEVFMPPRKLRTDPWLGQHPGAWPAGAARLAALVRLTPVPPLHPNSTIPKTLAERVRTFLAPARLTWQALVDETIPQGVKRMQALLEVIRNSANAAAVMSGAPLPMRRLFMELPDRCTASGLTELAGDLVQSFTNESVTDENWEEWFIGWESAYDQLNEIGKAPVTLNLTRKNYYLKAIKGLAEERPAAAVWITALHLDAHGSADLPKADEPYKAWQALDQTVEPGYQEHPCAPGICWTPALDSIEEALRPLRREVTHHNYSITTVDNSAFSVEKSPFLWRNKQLYSCQ